MKMYICTFVHIYTYIYNVDSLLNVTGYIDLRAICWSRCQDRNKNSFSFSEELR